MESKNGALSFTAFSSLRAKCAYVAHSTQPLVTHAVATLAQVTRDKFAETHIKTLEQVVRDMKSRNDFVYHPIFGKDLEIVICVDAAYANNAHYSSQIGVLALLRDTESNKCEVLHHLSKKSRRVCRAVL